MSEEANTTNTAFNDVASRIAEGVQSEDATMVKASLNALTTMSPEVAPVVQQTQTYTANKVFDAIGSRFGNAEGMASGDTVNGYGLWAQGMYNRTKFDGTSISNGYDTDSYGFAMGLEGTLNPSTKLGLGYAYTGTDIDGFLRSTDAKTHTAFVYGEYKPSNWYVNAVASYGWSDYDEDKFVMGTKQTASYDANTFGLQAMTGLDMQVAGMTMTPEVGMRYYRISQDGYTDTLGTQVSSSDSDILTGVLGVRMGTQWQPCSTAVLKPEFRVAMTYDLVDADNDSIVALANGATYRVEGETLDRFGVEMGVGVTAQVYDNIELGLSYEGGFRGDYQNHTGMINAKYKF